MAKNSSIEWTHHTFNPWWGCAKVSPACKHCYAETWAKRVGESVWGARSPRRFFGENHWSAPLKWNCAAADEGERKRVFCASMADVFERRAELNEWREKLWDLIEETPMLDWLLLTKRPQGIDELARWADGKWPENVWLGTTVENQHWAERRLPELMKHTSTVRFLSCEPLLGELDLTSWMAPDGSSGIDWVIAGGESGAKSRVMKPQWVRSLRDQCVEASVAFHFKQWGHWGPVDDEKEGNPKTIKVDGEVLASYGKKATGRKLDNKYWDEIPVAV